jgi:hypothetical protein
MMVGGSIIASCLLLSIIPAFAQVCFLSYRLAYANDIYFLDPITFILPKAKVFLLAACHFYKSIISIIHPNNWHVSF